jgi:alpha-soluble NSF attachment protein
MYTIQAVWPCHTAIPPCDVAQAEKKLKGFGFFGNKWEDASELFEKAANNYKLAKCWNDASAMYVQLAECHIKCDSKHEAASALVEAAKVAAKSQPQRSTELLHRAVALYTDMGRLNMAARQLKEIAEVNEKQNLKEEAITFYEQAADLFETDGSTSEATKCRWGETVVATHLGGRALLLPPSELHCRANLDPRIGLLSGGFL